MFKAPKLIQIKIALLIVVSGWQAPANAQFKSLDKYTLIEMSEHRGTTATSWFMNLSKTNNYISVGIPAGLMVAGIIRGDADMKKKALYIGESIVVSTGITFAMKHTFKRSRPYVKYPNEIIPVYEASSPSLPSGHSSEAFAAATAVSIAYPKWYVITPAYLWASQVAYSRMYLGVHYPTDVALGAVVGAGSAWLTYKANQWLQHKKQVRKVNNTF